MDAHKFIKDVFGRLTPNEFLMNVALGLYGDDILPVHKFGFNDNILATEETIWDAGGLYPWLTVAEVASIVSTDANDAFGGTGAQTVKISGLDENYDLVDEIVELDGLTPVLTTTTFLRISRMTVPPLLDGGGEPIAGQGNAAGSINASQSATVRAQILNGNNQTLMAVLTVPRGYTGILVHGSAGTGSGKEATVKYYVRPFLGVFNLGYIVQLFENNEQRPFVLPQAINEKSDIDVRAISGVVGVQVSANFDLVLVRNGILAA